jgi:ribonucleotide reductase alpha subunit
MPLEMSPNARVVLEHRYLARDETGRVVETPEAMFWRVAHAVAEADLLYEGPAAATVEEVRRLFELAWRLRCKDLTVHHHGWRGETVLPLGKVPAFAAGPTEARADGVYTGDCRLCAH